MSKKSNHLLELVMFDIAYVISNCDYEYSSDEKNTSISYSIDMMRMIESY